ncbi:MAG: DNA repair protein RadC [Dehalococcoidaceae bacterium]|nr:DNA repair protein RadC [Dehalococcoidaceae bacterium]
MSWQTEPVPLRSKPEDNKGHRQRLRERFAAKGIDALTEYEIVELLLILGTPRKDVKSQAKAAIRLFGNLKGVLEASPEQLAGIEGLGRQNTVAIQIIRSVAEKWLQEKAMTSLKPEQYFNSADDVYNYLKASMSTQPVEIFKVLYLNNRNRLEKIEDLFTGTVNRSAVYPREVMQKALKHHATGLIFAHNHPSGCLEPSPEDKNLTRTLVFGAILMQLKVLDHVIVARDGYYSFSARGLIERYEAEYIKLNMPA